MELMHVLIKSFSVGWSSRSWLICFRTAQKGFSACRTSHFQSSRSKCRQTTTHTQRQWVLYCSEGNSGEILFLRWPCEDVWGFTAAKERKREAGRSVSWAAGLSKCRQAARGKGWQTEPVRVNEAQSWKRATICTNLCTTDTSSTATQRSCHLWELLQVSGGALPPATTGRPSPNVPQQEPFHLKNPSNRAALGEKPRTPSCC